MIEWEPVKDFLLIERAVSRGSKIQLPDKAEPASDDIFIVIKAGPGDSDNPQLYKPGDLIALVGYINCFSYKGEKAVLGRARDVMAVIHENS